MRWDTHIRKANRTEKYWATTRYTGLRSKFFDNSIGENKRPLVCIDESYVHRNYTVSKCSHSSEEKGVVKKDGAGCRISCNVGGDMGFIDGALPVFKSKTKREN